MDHPWINTTDYTIPQLILFGIAAALWVWAYIIVVRDITKYRFVGIPVLAVCANIAWEMLWSLRFYTDMGALFEWGYRIWFMLDIYIFYAVIRFGKIQLSDIRLQRYFVPIILFTFLSWAGGVYAFTSQYHDPIGAVSAYLVNTHMSALYLLLIVKFPKQPALSLKTAWIKMLGTALTSVFCFWVFPQYYFMLTMTVVTFILDITYIYVVGKVKATHTD